MFAIASNIVLVIKFVLAITYSTKLSLEFCGWAFAYEPEDAIGKYAVSEGFTNCVVLKKLGH